MKLKNNSYDVIKENGEERFIPTAEKRYAALPHDIINLLTSVNDFFKTRGYDENKVSFEIFANGAIRINYEDYQIGGFNKSEAGYNFQILTYANDEYDNYNFDCTSIEDIIECFNKWANYLENILKDEDVFDE
ncbi:MAG: hypothetical protein ACK5L6_05225 [Anaerorhabdus sp.]|uniref:hypothetical protein n=1 Tax=Anaerorhabdus sp. TaxID=1872524 RepID=UPI003A8B6A21